MVILQHREHLTQLSQVQLALRWEVEDTALAALPSNPHLAALLSRTLTPKTIASAR